MIFRAVAKPSNSGKSAKFSKARKIRWNSVEILSNTCLYNIFEIFSANLWNMQTTSQKYQAYIMSDQHKTRSISSEFFLKKKHKIGCFYWLLFTNSRQIGRFFYKFVPKNPAKFTFFRDLLEALHSMAWSIRLENTMDRSRYKFGGKLALFIRFGTFLWWKQSKIIWNVCVNFALLI